VIDSNTSGCRAWTTLAALPPAVLAHDRPRSLAAVLGGALPASPMRDERCRAWTTLGALAAAVLAHGRPSLLAAVLGGALPASPIRDERGRAWTALAAAVLAHGHPSPLAPLLAAAFPASPIRDNAARPPFQGRLFATNAVAPPLGARSGWDTPRSSPGRRVSLDEDRVEPAGPDEAAPPADAPVVGWDTGVQWEAADATPVVPPHVSVSVGSVLARTLDLFLRRPLVFIALALPGTILSLTATGPSDSELVINGFPWLVFLLDLLLSIVSILATVIAADDLRAARSAGIVSVIRRAVDRTPVAIGSSIVQYVALIGVWLLGALILSGLLTSDSGPLGILLLIVLGIAILYRFMRWSLANAAIALERVGPIAALGRSRVLTAGNVRRISGLYLLLVVLSLPLDLAVYLLSFAGTDEGLRNVLVAVSGLATGPLLAIASAVLLGDLTGRPETASSHPAASPLRIAFVAVLVILGGAGIAIAVPGVGPALERQGYSDLADGKVIVGTGRDPAHPCTPTGVDSIFPAGQTLYLGGALTFPVLQGEQATIEIYANDVLLRSDVLASPSSLECIDDGEPIVGTQPGPYRVVVTWLGETIADGTFLVR
jgi:hypothetical protein